MMVGMVNDKTILVIDTAMEGCGVAVCGAVKGAGRDVVFDAYNDEAHGQAQRLVPMVQGVLADAGIGFDDLSDIVVVNGPGTFTGIRIGLSAAKAFGLAMEIPVWGISSLQALALSVDTGGDDMLGIVETRRADFYVQRFGGDGRAIDGAVSVVGDDVAVDGAVLIGNAVARFDPNGLHICAGGGRVDVGAIGRAFAEGRDVFVRDVQPIYLRAPDVSHPKKEPRKLAGK